MTDDSALVHVRLTGTDGVTSGIVLQSSDKMTSQHLAANKHVLMAALNAAGVDVSNLKIDVVSASNGSGDAGNNQDGSGSNASYGGTLSGGQSGNGAGQSGQQAYGATVASGGTQSDSAVDSTTQATSTTARGAMQGSSGINITA